MTIEFPTLYKTRYNIVIILLYTKYTNKQHITLDKQMLSYICNISSTPKTYGKDSLEFAFRCGTS